MTTTVMELANMLADGTVSLSSLYDSMCMALPSAVKNPDGTKMIMPGVDAIMSFLDKYNTVEGLEKAITKMSEFSEYPPEGKEMIDKKSYERFFMTMMWHIAKWKLQFMKGDITDKEYKTNAVLEFLHGF